MNRLIISGRPTDEPRIFYSGSGEEAKTIVRFTIASNRIFKKEGETNADFIPCVAFGKTAKTIETYVHKGSHILITGPLRNNNYEDKDGRKVYGYQMVTETVELLDKKKEQMEIPEDADGYLQIPEEMLAEMPFQ